jgi:hypothetical protein
LINARTTVNIIRINEFLYKNLMQQEHNRR